MMADDGNRRLGRGLAALIGEMDQPVEQGSATRPRTVVDTPAIRPDRTVAVETISPNRSNPRRHFDDDELQDLANSLREHGLVQPILVRPMGDGFEIIAGERRWRAAQIAQLDQVPVIVRDVDDRVSLELAIVENVQRADLNPIEEAQGYRQLMDEHEYTQVDLGRVIGKSRSHVANTLRLLNLPDGVLSMVTDGRLSAGHARALITAPHPEAMAARVLDSDLSVRETERLVGEAQGPKPRRTKASPDTDADLAALERRLQDHLGMKASIKPSGDSAGRLTLTYRTLEQFDSLMERLTGASTRAATDG